MFVLTQGLINTFGARESGRKVVILCDGDGDDDDESLLLVHKCSSRLG